MTRSIASRLREGNLFCQEAADYIEKLEAALAHIYAWYPVSVSHPAQTIEDIRDFARNALEGKMVEPAKCHCGSISWERNMAETRFTCCSCKRPLWQPMQTAPKDGRTILVYGHWAVDDSVPDIAFAYWDDDARFCIFDAEEMLTMLYWMPLPDGPRA